MRAKRTTGSPDHTAGLRLSNTLLGSVFPCLALTPAPQGDIGSLASSQPPHHCHWDPFSFPFPIQTKISIVKVRWRQSGHQHVGPQEELGLSPVSPGPAERLTGFSAAHSTPPDFSHSGPNSLLLQDPGPLTWVDAPSPPFHSTPWVHTRSECSSR